MDRTGNSGTEIRYPTRHLLAKSAQELVDEIAGRGAVPSCPTGLDVIDSGTHGLHPGRLFTVAARTSQGKSAFITNLALNLATIGKFKTTLATLEMDHKEIIERMFCIKYKVDGFSLLKGQVSGMDKNWAEFCRFLDDADKKSTLRIIDDYCTKESELLHLFENLGHRPDVLIIDHINHIQPENFKMDERLAISMYSRYLKELAKAHKMCVILVAQINREGNDKPSLKDLKGSGTLEEVSDAVFLLHMVGGEEEVMNNFTVYIAKNRFGPRGKKEIYFHAPWFKFYTDYNDYICDGGSEAPAIRKPDYHGRIAP